MKTEDLRAKVKALSGLELIYLQDLTRRLVGTGRSFVLLHPELRGRVPQTAAETFADLTLVHVHRNVDLAALYRADMYTLSEFWAQVQKNIDRPGANFPLEVMLRFARIGERSLIIH